MATFTCNGNSTGSGSVQDVHDNQVVDGGTVPGTPDIIQIPQGSFNWTTPIVLSKVCTLQGAGQNTSGAWLTNILDKNTVGTAQLLKLKMKQGWRTEGAGHTFSTQVKAPIRVTGIRFTNGGRTGTGLQQNATPPDPYNSGGNVNISGHDQRTDSQFRIDHCFFDGIPGVFVFDTVTGVFDSTIIVNSNTAFLYPKASWWQLGGIVNSNYNNPQCRWADGSRADGIRWGSTEFVYFEDCTLQTTPAGNHGGITDMFGGARMVFRNNLIIDGVITSHGTEGSGGGRSGGIRAVEVYGNQFRNDGSVQNTTALVVMRSGVHTMYDNTVVIGTAGRDYGTNNPRISLQCYRCYNGTDNTKSLTWGAATSANDMDVNSGPYATGTFNATSAGPYTVNTITSHTIPFPWAQDQFFGYTILNRTAFDSGRTLNTTNQVYGTIVSNTASSDGHSTFTCLAPFEATTRVAFQAGDVFEINRVEHAIDSPGWGQGTLFDSNKNPGVLPDGANGTGPAWANNNQDQVNERTYVWGGNNYGSATGSSGSTIVKFGVGDSGDAAAQGIQRPGYIALNVHPLVGAPVATIINSTFKFSTDAASQSFTVQTQGFTNPAGVTFSVPTVTAVPSGATPATLPNNVAFHTATGVFDGTAVGAVPGIYTMTLQANTLSPAESATLEDFKLEITSPHVGPDVTLISPTSGQSFVSPADITLTANPIAHDSPIFNVEFYNGTTLIGSPVTSAPYTLLWSGVTTGTYSLTAKVYDTFLPAGTATSTPINITVTNPSALIAPTISVRAGTGQPFPVTTKKILHWQATNNNRIATVVANRTYVDTLPFDGLILSFPSYQDLVGPSSVADYATLTTEVSPINGALTNITHNYLNILSGATGMQDPFDSWTQTIANFVTIARVCKEQGLEGIFFDNEEYGVHWWTYPTDVAHAGSHTLSAYQEEWRQRGRDTMAAMIAEWPALKIVHTLGPNRSVTAVPTGGMFNGNPSWLGGYFFMGMFEQEPSNHVISGGELYYIRTAANFINWKNFFDTIYNQGNAALMPSGLNTTWNASDNLSFGIYDQDTVGSPVMSSSVLQTTLVNAMPAADEFIWNYSESGLEWLTSAGGTATNGWQAAVRAARATLGLPTL